MWHIIFLLKRYTFITKDSAFLIKEAKSILCHSAECFLFKYKAFRGHKKTKLILTSVIEITVYPVIVKAHTLEKQQTQKSHYVYNMSQ